MRGLEPTQSIEVFEKENLRAVLFDCPYNTICDPASQDLFGKLLSLKIKGFREQYPYGVLPFDPSDLAATHILICKIESGIMHPVLGFKSITYERCNQFMLKFPGLSLVDGVEDPRYRIAIEQICSNASKFNLPLAYNGSLTVDPTFQKQTPRGFASTLATYLFLRYYKEMRPPNVIAGAAMRFKVHELKQFAGFKMVEYDHTALEPFHCKFAFGEQVALMHLEQMNPLALNWCEPFESIWENRLEIKAASHNSKLQQVA